MENSKHDNPVDEEFGGMFGDSDRDINLNVVNATMVGLTVLANKGNVAEAVAMSLATVLATNLSSVGITKKRKPHLKMAIFIVVGASALLTAVSKYKAKNQA